MVLCPDHERLVCSCSVGFRGTDGVLSTEERTANAKLIAAAPELLALLQEAEKLYSTHNLMAHSIACGHWINETRAAITKATE